jgi:hypothetical protein
MKKIYLGILLLSSLCSAQAQQWEWLKQVDTPYDHRDLKTAIDGFGNIYMASEINFPNWSTPSTIIYKLDAEGTEQAQYTFPASFIFNDMEINSQNQLLITGYFYDTLQIGSEQFISAGSADLFLGAFASNFQLIWGKRIGGAQYDRGFALIIDNNDNFFLCGRISDTINFEGTILNCHSSGNSFVAKFDLTGQLDWVIKDSTERICQNYSSYSFATDIAINSNNELLVTGQLDQLNYFFFNGLPLTIPPLDPWGYNYGCIYAIKMDLNGNAVWDSCIKIPRTAWFDFAGFTSVNSLVIQNDAYGGDHTSSFTLLDNNGTPYKTINVDSIVNGESLTFPLATINDRNYLMIRRNNYDSLGRLPDYICTIINSELVIIDSIRGHIWSSSLLKNANDEFYLAGIFNNRLTAGNHSLGTDSTGNEYNYYGSNPYISKLTFPLLEIGEINTDLSYFRIFPNPTTSILNVEWFDKLTNSKMQNAELKIYNTFGELIHQQIIKSANHQIDLSSQPKGIYFLEMGDVRNKIVLN